MTDRWTLLKFVYLLCRYLPISLWPYVMWGFILDHTQEECTGSVIVLQHMIFIVLVIPFLDIRYALLKYFSSNFSLTVGRSSLPEINNCEFTSKNVGVLALRAYAYTGQRRRVRLLLTTLLSCYFAVQLWGNFSGGDQLSGYRLIKWLGRSSCLSDSSGARHQLGASTPPLFSSFSPTDVFHSTSSFVQFPYGNKAPYHS